MHLLSVTALKRCGLQGAVRYKAEQLKFVFIVVVVIRMIITMVIIVIIVIIACEERHLC